MKTIYYIISIVYIMCMVAPCTTNRVIYIEHDLNEYSGLICSILSKERFFNTKICYKNDIAFTNVPNDNIFLKASMRALSYAPEIIGWRIILSNEIPARIKVSELLPKRPIDFAITNVPKRAWLRVYRSTDKGIDPYYRRYEASGTSSETVEFYWYGPGEYILVEMTNKYDFGYMKLTINTNMASQIICWKDCMLSKDELNFVTTNKFIKEYSVLRKAL